MKEYEVKVNGATRRIFSDSDKPLLWILREDLHLTGTKFGCGLGVCGACVVHIDGAAARACQITIGECHSKNIKTIEGLSDQAAHFVQQAWIEENVPQCGYCQSGQIMSAAALLENNLEPTKNEINEAMSDNYCRCGTYVRIEKAIQKAIQFRKHQEGA